MSDRPKDVLLVGAQTEGDGWAVLRRREDRLEVGELREMKEGRPISGSGDVVKLRRRDEHPRLFDVEVLAELPARSDGAGPAQVATDAYREGWERVFGEAPKPN